MAKLTYADKTNTSAIVDRTKQIVSEDLNEIKESVNALYDADDVITSDITTLEGQMTTAESDIDSLEDRADILENYYANYDSTVSITTSDTFQTKLTLTLPAEFTAGTYIIEVFYGWNHDSTTTSFEARVDVDDVQEGEIHKQKPFDASGSWESTGTDQRMYVARRFKKVMTAGTHTIRLKYRTDTAGDESAVWDTSISIREE